MTQPDKHESSLRWGQTTFADIKEGQRFTSGIGCGVTGVRQML